MRDKLAPFCCGNVIAPGTVINNTGSLPNVSNNLVLNNDPGDATINLAGSNTLELRNGAGGGVANNYAGLVANAGANQVRENTWQIVYIGQAQDPTDGVLKSQWVVSGVYACPGANPPSIQAGRSSAAAGWITP